MQPILRQTWPPKTMVSQLNFLFFSFPFKIYKTLSSTKRRRKYKIYLSNKLIVKWNLIDSAPVTKKRITARTEWQINNMDLSEHLSMHHKQREQSTPSSLQQASHASSSRHFSNRKRRCPSAEIKRTTSSPLSLEQRSDISASPAPQTESA